GTVSKVVNDESGCHGSACDGQQKNPRKLASCRSEAYDGKIQGEETCGRSHAVQRPGLIDRPHETGGTPENKHAPPQSGGRWTPQTSRKEAIHQQYRSCECTGNPNQSD